MSVVPGQPDLSLPASVPSAQLSIAATRRLLDRAESFVGLLQQKLKTQIGNVLNGIAQGGATLELKAVTPINQIVGDAEQFHAQLVDAVHNDLAAKLAVAKVALDLTPPSPAGPGDCTNRYQVHPLGSNFFGWEVCGSGVGGSMFLRRVNPTACAQVGRNLTGTTSNPDALAACGGVQTNPDPTIWYYDQWPGESDPPMMQITQVDDFLLANDANSLVGALGDFSGDWNAALAAVASNQSGDPAKCVPCAGPPPPPCPSWKVYSTTQTSNDCIAVCSTDQPPAGKTYLRGTFGTETEAQQYTSNCNNVPPPTGCCPAVVCPPPVVNCGSPPTCQYVSVCDLPSWDEWMKQFCRIYKSDCVGKAGSECKVENIPAWSVEECASEWRDPIEAWMDDTVPAVAADTTYHDRDDLLHQMLASISLGQFIGKDPLRQLVA